MLTCFVQLLRCFFHSRQQLLLENALLRQHLIIYQQSVRRPKLKPIDRLILVWLSRIFTKWKNALMVVKPDTVIGWHRKGFKLYWRWKCRKAGRPVIDWPLIKLIRKLQKENPLWSPQRIQGELAKLGFSVCDNTVLKYLRKPKPDFDKRQRWRTFLKNHAHCIVAIDFLVVRTLFFKAIYVFIAISHNRRKILHFAVSSKPHSQWAIQQLRETFSFDETTRYVIRDNDAIFSEDFKQHIKRLGLEDTPTAPHSPWQNSICERVNGTLRREGLACPKTCAAARQNRQQAHPRRPPPRLHPRRLKRNGFGQPHAHSLRRYRKNTKGASRVQLNPPTICQSAFIKQQF